MRDRDHDVGDGAALHVEESAVDHVLGLERDVGGWLVGVRIQCDPAHAKAGRDRDGTTLRYHDDDVRGASSRNRPDPSARASPIGTRFTPDRPGTFPIALLPAQTMAVALRTGLPLGSSTRPTTNMRPGPGCPSASSAFATISRSGFPA